MSQTVAALLPLLTFAASSAGAGLLASILFARLRDALPLPAVSSWWATLLYAPRYARITSLALAGWIGVAASVTVAHLTGADPRIALDAAVAAVISQVVHARSLSPDAPNAHNDADATRGE